MGLDINTKKLKKNAFRVSKERGIGASRIRVPGGYLNAEVLGMVQEIAQTYGNGYVHLTTRQGFEIEGIRLEDMDEINQKLAENGDGFVRAMWCGDEECEDKVKELTGVGSRCIPFEQKNLSDKCVCCGKPAKHMVVWGRQY